MVEALLCLCWNGAWTVIVEWTMEWTLELKEKHFLFPTVLCNYLLTISIHSQLALYCLHSYSLFKFVGVKGHMHI